MVVESPSAPTVEVRARPAQDTEALRLRMRIAGLACQLRHGPAVAARARAGFMARFEHDADPERVLPPEVRQTRARQLLKIHMARLRLKAIERRAAESAQTRETPAA